MTLGGRPSLSDLTAARMCTATGIPEVRRHDASEPAGRPVRDGPAVAPSPCPTPPDTILPRRARTRPWFRQLDLTGIAGAALLLLIVLGCVAAPVLAPQNPVGVNMAAQMRPPSVASPLGTDNFGRDILARILHGGRVSLAVAVAATAVSLLLALVLGGPAGYLGGAVDGAVTRLIDLTLAFPRLVLAITIAGLLGAGLASVVVAIVAVSWAWYARLVRGMILQAREEQYVLAAHALGASTPRILLAHLLPAIGGQVAVLTSLDFGRLLLNISALSFLGLGIRPPAPEWGAMLNEGRTFFARSPELMLYPGLAIFLTVLATNLLGDALRDALDPRARAG